jgi:hypothetical protein
VWGFATTALKMLDAEPHMIDEIMWSDEKMFYRLTQSNKGVIPIGGRVKVRTKVQAPDHKMCWVGFTTNHSTPLFWHDTTVDSDAYMKCLTRTLQPFCKGSYEKAGHTRLYFQQDNAPCHVSCATVRWLFENQDMNGVKVMRIIWPACSPDLNPVEPYWSWLNNQMKMAPNPPHDTGSMVTLLNKIHSTAEAMSMRKTIGSKWREWLQKCVA